MAEMDPKIRRRSGSCRNICLAASAAILVTAIVLLILCLTVFKPKDPKTTVDSVALKDLSVGLSFTTGVTVNVTLSVALTVKNPNKVGFKYSDSTAVLNYRGTQVGDASIGSGRIPADGSVPMHLTLTVIGDRILGKSELSSDVMAGALPFNTRTKISGKAIVLGVFKIHVVSTSSCDFSVYVSNRTVGDQKCTYKTNF